MPREKRNGGAHCQGSSDREGGSAPRRGREGMEEPTARARAEGEPTARALIVNRQGRFKGRPEPTAGARAEGGGAYCQGSIGRVPPERSGCLRPLPREAKGKIFRPFHTS